MHNRWRICFGLVQIAWAGIGYGILFGLPQLVRQGKKVVAKVGLESDQAEMIDRLAQRLSPDGAKNVRVSLHEMFNEARIGYDLKPWRLRLLL